MTHIQMIQGILVKSGAEHLLRAFHEVMVELKSDQLRILVALWLADYCNNYLNNVANYDGESGVVKEMPDELYDFMLDFIRSDKKRRRSVQQKDR